MTKLQEIKSIIDELRSDNSSNFKLQALQKHKDNEDWKKYLYYTYNPNFNYYINKIPKVYYQGSKTCFDVVINTMDKFRNQELRGNKGIEVLTLMLELCDENEAEVIELLIGRDIKCGINVTSINKVYKDLIPETSYCGCQGFRIDKIKEAIEEDGFVYSETKNDGRFVNIILTENIEMVSRSGKPTYLSDNCNLIKASKELKSKLDDYYTLTGELMVKGYNRLQSNGIVARIININEKLQEEDFKKADKSKKELEKEFDKTFEELENLIYVVVWDIIPYKDYINQKCIIHRIKRVQFLEETLESFNNDYIIKQEYKKCYSFQEVIQDLKEKLENGEEGTVIKAPSAIWSHGKKELQFKGKIVFNTELRIIGFNEGTKGTKYEGTLGSIICQSEDGLIVTNVSGIEETAKNKDFSRDYIWNNKEEFLNGVLEIKCNGLSKNKNGGYNFFYPNYVKFRSDKDKAQTQEEIIEIERAILSVTDELNTIKVNVSKSNANLEQSLQDFLNG